MITGTFRPSSVALGRMMSIATRSVSPLRSESNEVSSHTRSRIASA
jgi:hypothetical protein